MTHHLLWLKAMLGQFWWPTIHCDSIQCQDSSDDPPFTMIQYNVRTVLTTHHLLWLKAMLGQFWWPTFHYDSIQCQGSSDDPPFTMIQYNVRTVLMTHHSLWFNTMLGQFWWPTIYYDSKQCQDSCDDPPFTMIQSNVRWQLQWPTSTGLPHDLGENPISPFVCGQVKLSIQLCQWHGFGVQWVVLSSERCTKHHHRIHQKSEIINTQKTSHVFTRMPGEWVTRKMSHLVFTCTPGKRVATVTGFFVAVFVWRLSSLSFRWSSQKFSLILNSAGRIDCTRIL